jgi:hypothetical protein
MMTTRASPVLAVIAGGAIAGILDTVYACVVRGVCGSTPIDHFEDSVGGLLSLVADRSSAHSAAVALALHILILIAAAALFSIAVRKSRWAASHAIGTGLLYGACIYLVIGVAGPPLTVFSYKAAVQSAGRCVESVGSPGIRWSPRRLADAIPVAPSNAGSPWRRDHGERGASMFG